MSDLDLLDIGMIFDMFTEQANDSIEYPILASEEDYAKF